jgi:hypothetical protein
LLLYDFFYEHCLQSLSISIKSEDRGVLKSASTVPIFAAAKRIGFGASVSISVLLRFRSHCA